MTISRGIDLAFSAAFAGTALYGVSELFSAVGDPRDWVLPAYSVGVGYALFSALRSYSYPRESRRARAEREVARERWHGS